MFLLDNDHCSIKGGTYYCSNHHSVVEAGYSSCTEKESIEAEAKALAEQAMQKYLKTLVN